MAELQDLLAQGRRVREAFDAETSDLHAFVAQFGDGELEEALDRECNGGADTDENRAVLDAHGDNGTLWAAFKLSMREDMDSPVSKYIGSVVAQAKTLRDFMAIVDPIKIAVGEITSDLFDYIIPAVKTPPKNPAPVVRLTFQVKINVGKVVQAIGGLDNLIAASQAVSEFDKATFSDMDADKLQQMAKAWQMFGRELRAAYDAVVKDFAARTAEPTKRGKKR